MIDFPSLRIWDGALSDEIAVIILLLLSP